MTAVIQLAVVMALAMPLAWLANALVLPLVLRALVRRPTKPAGAALGGLGGGGLRLDGAAGGGAAAPGGGRRAAGAAGSWAAGVEGEGRVPRLRRPAPRLAAGRGDCPGRGHRRRPVPVAVQVEAAAPGGALERAVVRAAERAAAFLRSFPEIAQANSLADFVRPAFALTAGADAGEGGLPDSPEGMAQALESLGDRRATREVLSADRGSLAAVGRVLCDVGVQRTAAIMEALDAWVGREQAALDAAPGGPRLRLTATGQLRLFEDVNSQLLGGLAASFGGAVLLSLLLMSLALRSWRLGLLGLVPNATPVLLVLAFMGAAGIPLSPVTVMAFSITLVVADDDTIQFLARFREHHAAARGLPPREAHRAAVFATVGEVGVPMLVSGVAVSAGFGLLLLSGFLGPARLGALIGATLAGAVVVDLFLTPLLLAHLTPLGGAGHRGPEPDRGLLAAGRGGQDGGRHRQRAGGARSTSVEPPRGKRLRASPFATRAPAGARWRIEATRKPPTSTRASRPKRPVSSVVTVRRLRCSTGARWPGRGETDSKPPGTSRARRPRRRRGRRGGGRRPGRAGRRARCPRRSRAPGPHRPAGRRRRGHPLHLEPPGGVERRHGEGGGGGRRDQHRRLRSTGRASGRRVRVKSAFRVGKPPGGTSASARSFPSSAPPRARGGPRPARRPAAPPRRGAGASW